MATCGAYAVSAEGRSRWDVLPDLHSDDKWFVGTYRTYLSLLWLAGEIGGGAGDVAGGADWRTLGEPQAEKV